MFNRRTILPAFVLLVIAQSAPAAEGFTTLDGSPASLETPAVVNFWATWCAPCIKELPDLETLGQKLGDDARVYLVNFGETTDTILAFQAKRPELFGAHTELLKDAEMKGLSAYNVRGIPTTVLINAEGETVDTIQGLKAWGDDVVVAEIRAKIVD